MTKDVKLKITGHQTDEIGEETKIIRNLTGEFYERNQSIYLLYDEIDPDNQAVTRNTLKISGAVITLTRKGDISSQMVFETDRTTSTTYRTPFGTFLFDLKTEYVSILLGDTQGTIRIVYDLLCDGAFVSKNELTLKVRNL